MYSNEMSVHSLRWVFSRFLNCRNGNKSCTASHMFVCIYCKSPLFSSLLSSAFSAILMIFEATMTPAKRMKMTLKLHPLTHFYMKNHYVCFKLFP